MTRVARAAGPGTAIARQRRPLREKERGVLCEVPAPERYAVNRHLPDLLKYDMSVHGEVRRHGGLAPHNQPPAGLDHRPALRRRDPVEAVEHVSP